MLDKSEATERGKRENSVMPRGLVNPLTVEERASLIAYLEALNVQSLWLHGRRQTVSTGGRAARQEHREGVRR